jgi:hypothetical protein
VHIAAQPKAQRQVKQRPVITPVVIGSIAPIAG